MIKKKREPIVVSEEMIANRLNELMSDDSFNSKQRNGIVYSVLNQIEDEFVGGESYYNMLFKYFLENKPSIYDTDFAIKHKDKLVFRKELISSIYDNIKERIDEMISDEDGVHDVSSLFTTGSVNAFTKAIKKELEAAIKSDEFQKYIDNDSSFVVKKAVSNLEKLGYQVSIKKRDRK
jgi:hypothetical protein